MDMQRGFGWCLLAAALSGGVRVTAQASSKVDGRGTFVVKLTGQTIDAPEQAAGHAHSALMSKVYWDNLYNVGKVAVVGAAKEGSMSFGVMILEGVSASEAASIANGDPSVKAGMTSAEVLPLQVLQAKNLTRPKLKR